MKRRERCTVCRLKHKEAMMLVRIIDKKDRINYFIWYMATMLSLTVVFTMILMMDRGYIGKDLLWVIILLGIFGAFGLVITYLKGRDIQMLQRAGKYKEYIALWDFSPSEWKRRTGESIPEDEKRFVMFMRKGITVGLKLHSWNRIGMKLEKVEVAGESAGKSVQITCSVMKRVSGSDKRLKEYHAFSVPVPEGADVEQAIMRLKKENRLSQG
jgi:hypothetical protein